MPPSEHSIQVRAEQQILNRSNAAASTPPQASLPADHSFVFKCLIVFLFIVLVAPQNVFWILQPLHLARVTAVLAVATYAFQRFSSGASIFPAGPEFRLITIFSLLALISVPGSYWSGGSMEVFFDLYAKSIVIYVLISQLLTTVDRFKRMLWFMVIFMIMVCGLALVGYQSGDLLGGFRMRGGPGGLTMNPNDFALTVNLFIPFAIALYMTSQHGIPKLLSGGFLALSVGSILLTFSRAGFLTMMIIFGLVLLKFLGGGRGMKLVFPIMLVVATVAFLSPTGYGDRLESIADMSKDVTGSSQARWDVTLKTLPVIAEHPLIGVGMGMNILALNQMGVRWNPVHNVYLEIASEIGLPALLVYLMLLRQVFRSTRDVQQKCKGVPAKDLLHAFAVAAEISLLAFMIAALFHPVAYHFYFYLSAGFAMALKGISDRWADNGQAVATPVPRWTQRDSTARLQS